MIVMGCLHQVSQRCDFSGERRYFNFLPTRTFATRGFGDRLPVTVKVFSAAQVVHKMSPHLLGARALVDHSVHSEGLNLSYDTSEQRRSDFIGCEICHWPQFSNAHPGTNVTNVQKICRLIQLSWCGEQWYNLAFCSSRACPLTALPDGSNSGV